MLVHDISYRPLHPCVKLRCDTPPTLRSHEVSVAQIRWQVSERALTIDPPPGRRYCGGTSITCENIDSGTFKPTRFVQGHGNRQRFLAGRTGCAPDLQGGISMLGEQLRNQGMHQDMHGVDLTPEIGLLIRQHIDQRPPCLSVYAVISKQVVVV